MKYSRNFRKIFEITIFLSVLCLAVLVSIDIYRYFFNIKYRNVQELALVMEDLTNPEDSLLYFPEIKEAYIKLAHGNALSDSIIVEFDNRDPNYETLKIKDFTGMFPVFKKGINSDNLPDTIKIDILRDNRNAGSLYFRSIY